MNDGLTYSQILTRQRAEEKPSYFMCGKKSLPSLMEKARKEADEILKEFAGYYDTGGKLNIKIEAVNHSDICYSVAATLMWEGEPLQEMDDPCDLLFLQLNNMMLNRLAKIMPQKSANG